MGAIFWKLLKIKPTLAIEAQKKLKISLLTAKILSARFSNFQEINHYLKISNLQSTFEIKNMKNAVKRLKNAIKNNEKIAIYGDYDCDGVCASAMLFLFLKKFKANVVCKIPTRSEGYGLNLKAIKELKQNDVNLIITVDNGISAIEEANLISKLGIDLIITDHHNAMDTLPKAVAILNPKQKDDLSIFKHLCGAGVVLKLIAAFENDNFDFAFNFAGDLAAIATVADLVPLISENKTIVLKGLKKLKQTSNLGLKALLKLMFFNKNLNINSVDLAFKICPTINSAGRVKNAKLAFDLLISNNFEQAKNIAKKLIATNQNRKKIQQQLLIKAEQFIMQNSNCVNKPILIVYGYGWPAGLIGLIAGCLMHKFKKPTIVLTIENKIAIGSARSFEGFCVFDALKFCSNLFLKWGGHSLAGGLTLKLNNLKKFINKINEFAKTKNFAYIVKIDLCAKIENLNLFEIKQLKVLEPFGWKNKPPVFILLNLKLIEIVLLKNGTYLKLVFEKNHKIINVLAFNFNAKTFYFKKNDYFDVLTQVNLNFYKQKETLNFILIDLRPTKFNQKTFIESFKISKKLENQNLMSNLEKQTNKPSRNDFILVYCKIKQTVKFYGNYYDLFLLLCKKINYFKILIIVNVLIELKLIEYNGIYFKVLESKNQNNLNDSKFLKKFFDD